MDLYLCLLLGLITFILFVLNSTYKKAGFTWGQFIRDNWISWAINAVCGIILIFGRDEVSVFIPSLTVGRLVAAVFGVTGGAIFKFIIDSVNPEKQTAIGLNKPK